MYIKFASVIEVILNVGGMFSLQAYPGTKHSKPYSNVQVELHPSPDFMFPSSHWLDITISSPHLSTHSYSSFAYYVPAGHNSLQAVQLFDLLPYTNPE